ncbi:MAG: LiaI-LiaF-like domain-containing protein [Anaerolineae bacterium]
MNSENRRHISLVGPTLLIGLGLILLLNNLGYLNWSLWDALRLWPILLIAAGLEVLVGRRSLLGSVLAAIFLLVLLVGSIWLFGTVSGRGVAAETVEISYPLDGAETAEILLGPGVGELTVRALSDSANLIEGAIHLRQNETLTRRYQSGESALVALEIEGSHRYVGTGRGSTWDLGLNSEVPLDLTTDIGVGEMTLDLSRLTLDEATVDFGVAQVEISLPREGDVEISVDGGIGTVVVHVPSDTGIRVRADAGLVTRDFPEGYNREGDVYTSQNYADAETRIDMTIGLGIGTITVREGVGD